MAEISSRSSGLDFEGAVAIVTGASSGLGRAIAEEVARRGCKAVALNFVGDEKDGDAVAASVSALGAEPILVAGDVSEDEVCRKIVASVAGYGRINALFNNAGITTRTMGFDHRNMDAVNAEDFARIFAVNVVGPYQLTRAAVPLLEAGPGSSAVVMTSSLNAMTGFGSSIPYAASKGALNTLTLSLARALAPKIRVNAICPGYMDTAWYKVSDAEADAIRRNIAENAPLRVASRPEDIAGTAVFFASPAAAHVTGETLIVDAGVHLGFTTPPPHEEAK